MTNFRIAEASDLAAIVQTYNSTIPLRTATADLQPVSVDDKLQWFHSHNEEKRPLWVVLDDDKYAGWLSFNSFYGRPAYDGVVELSIYLEEGHRGKGIGKDCLQKAIDEAPSRDIHTLLGFIFAHNEASLELFYGFGFQVWGSLPKVAHMDGEAHDLVIVGKKL